MSILAFLLACQGYDLTPLDDHTRTAYPPEVDEVLRTDVTVQIPKPAVDVLFVIDNSCSMDAEQAALAQNFPVFSSYFALSGVDYHIGVVSTDMDDPNQSGRLRRARGLRWIDPDTPDPSGVFSDMARMGTGGSADETGREAAWTALEVLGDAPRNEGFEREDAELHIIFISDEDDASETSPISRAEFREWMWNRKETRDMVKAHAVVWPSGQSCPDGFSEGVSYEWYAARTGGIVGNICDTSWAPFMDALGLVTAGLKSEFFLSELPEIDPDWTIDVSVKTEVDGRDVTLRFDSCLAGCEVEYLPGRNSVVFTDFTPSPLDEVVITYDPRDTR
ncbi:MAG: hypothetical protein H6736_05575 [Alphaproteobacteria bacterium]|nr:hypothetical protein [Alphaproteobacteria bacterium]MCB9691269.1 hypothetical protein [Alphaproteobacteria bacterium]